MRQEIIYDIIRKPVITEKSTLLSENSQVTFQVAIDATKPAIKEAVEKLFGAKVKSVNTIRQRGKVKRFRGRIGQRNEFKKAVVTFAEGTDIDILGGVK